MHHMVSLFLYDNFKKIFFKKKCKIPKIIKSNHMSSFEEEGGFSRLAKKFSFKGDDVNEANFKPLKKFGSFAEHKEVSEFARFRSESIGSLSVESTPESDSPSAMNKFSKPSTSTGPEAVIIVDVFSTGAYLSHVLYNAGYSVVCVLSGDLKHLLEMVSKGLSYKFIATHVLDETDEDPLSCLLSRIKASVSMPIVAVIAGAETGVCNFHGLSHLLLLYMCKLHWN